MMPLVIFYLLTISVTFYEIVASPSQKQSSFIGINSALDNFPIIDGHNDLAHNLYIFRRNQIKDFHFDDDLRNDPVFGTKVCNSCHTDLPRLRAGKVGAQFWSAYVSCDSQFKDAVPRTLQQIDVIKRLIKRYPNDLQFATSSSEILKALEVRKIASLIGVEGGHSIDYKLAILRMFYELGVRYLTLTHTCTTPWADTSMLDNANISLVNLTNFGEKIILEMNRLGMMVDLAHVSYNVMNAALNVSKAPVIFSHSSAYGIKAHDRNVRDDVLIKLKNNKGIIMVNFYSKFVADNNASNATVYNVAEHINYIVDLIGVDYVGVGSDFDGITSVPEGLEDVSQYPNLFDILKSKNPKRWTIENLEKLSGRNFIRVFKAVEKVRDELSNLEPDESNIPEEDLLPFKHVIDNCVA